MPKGKLERQLPSRRVSTCSYELPCLKKFDLEIWKLHAELTSFGALSKLNVPKSWSIS